MNKKLLLSEQRIQNGVREISKILNKKYPLESDREPIVLIVLRGAFIFGADLVRQLDFKHRISFVQSSSYSNNIKEGEPQISGENISFFGKDIIIIEDIIDTGDTMEHLNRWCMQKGASTINIVTVIQKPDSKVMANEYIFLYPENDFLYGYGMDNNDSERNLKGIYKV